MAIESCWPLGGAASAKGREPPGRPDASVWWPLASAVAATLTGAPARARPHGSSTSAAQVAGSCAELDGLGVREAEYAASTPALCAFVLEMSTYFRARFRFFAPVGGRTHFYAIDRARLDHALWRNLARFATVTAVEGAAVANLLVEDGVVRGVRARLPGHAGISTLRARAVVGADGRYSGVARKAGAAATHQRNDRDTTLYFADWEGVAPYDDPEPLAHIHTSCDGFSFVLMPTADVRTAYGAARCGAFGGPTSTST